MKALRFSAKLYIVALGIGALVAAAVAVIRSNALDREDAVLALGFASLAALANAFPLPFGPARKLSLDSGVIVAAVLLLDPAAAVAVALVGAVTGDLVARLSPVEIVFDASQAAIHAAVGSLVLAVWGWRADQLLSLGPEQVPLLIAAGVAMYLVNTAAVALMIGAQEGIAPLPVWRDATTAGVWEEAVQFMLGLLAALLGQAAPWTLPVLVLPGIFMHRVLEAQRRAEDAREEMLGRVRRALEFRNEFLSITSHELRQPLTLLSGYAHLLSKEAKGETGSGIAEPLGAMTRQVARMTSLIDELVDVSRLETGQLRFTMAPFDLNDAVREIVEEVRLSSPDVTLMVEADEQGRCVRGDRIRIQQVIANLLTNAVRYSRASSPIRVSIQYGRDRATVSVVDSGIGIPQQLHETVFERRYREERAAARHADGSGLGLFISKTIVEHHGGEIGVRSEEDVGSTFFFTVPLAPEDRPAPPAPEPDPPTGTSSGHQSGASTT